MVCRIRLAGYTSILTDDGVLVCMRTVLWYAVGCRLCLADHGDNVLFIIVMFACVLVWVIDLLEEQKCFCSNE